MKYISILFFVFIIAIIILADNGILPHSIRAIYDFPNGDKLGHFVLFGLLDFFVTRAFFSMYPSKPRGWAAFSIGLTLAVFIGIEEWSQRFFSNRTSDVIDLLASYTGLVIFGFMAVIWKKPRGFDK